MEEQKEEIKTKDGKIITKSVTTITPKDGFVDKAQIDPSANYETSNQGFYGYAKNIHYEVEIDKKSQNFVEYSLMIGILILGFLLAILGPYMIKIMGGLFIAFGVYGLICISKNKKKKDAENKNTK